MGDYESDKPASSWNKFYYYSKTLRFLYCISQTSKLLCFFLRLHGDQKFLELKSDLSNIVLKVEVEYADGTKFNFSSEFLRIHSPAADGKVRSIGGEKVILRWFKAT